ncbi:MAG: hypothetical protein ACYC8S_01485 [Minisyncoccota bacterium]
MKNLRKGFIGLPVLISIVLGLIIVVGGVYFVRHQQSLPQFTTANNTTTSTTIVLQATGTPTTVKAVAQFAQHNNNSVANPPKNLSNSNGNITTAWKTYSNTQIGFSFKYPLDWGFSGELGSSNSYRPPYIWGGTLQKGLSFIDVDVLDISIDTVLKTPQSQMPKEFRSVTGFSSANFSGKKFVRDVTIPTYVYLLDMNGKTIEIEAVLAGSQQGEGDRSGELKVADSIARTIAGTF